MIPENHPYPKTRRIPDSHKTTIERGLIKSKAWLSLSGISPQVYTIFLLKRQMAKEGRKGEGKWVCANNGEIIFTYREAEKKFGISQPRFLRAIDDLIEHGFLDISKPGIPARKIATEYFIAERWREFGTDRFKHVERIKGLRAGYCSKTK